MSGEGKKVVDWRGEWLPFAPAGGAAVLLVVFVLAGAFQWASAWWRTQLGGLAAGSGQVDFVVGQALFVFLTVAVVGAGAVRCGRAREAVLVLVGGILCAIALATALPTLGVFVEPLSATIGVLLAALPILAVFRRPLGDRQRKVEAIFDRRASDHMVKVWRERTELLPWTAQRKEMALVDFRVLNRKSFEKEVAEKELFALMRFLRRQLEAILLGEGGFVSERSVDGFSIVYGFEPREGAIGAAVKAADEWRSKEQRIRQECENRWGVVPQCGLGLAFGEGLSAVEGDDIRVVSELDEVAARFSKLNLRFESKVLLDPAARKAAGDLIAVRSLDFEGRAGRWITREVFELVGMTSELGEEEGKALEAFAEGMERLREGNRAEAREALIRARRPGVTDPVLERFVGLASE
ncbi:MAG: hypothetical protein AAGJ79_13525 [Verrucomicrobiota bacterium]